MIMSNIILDKHENSITKETDSGFIDQNKKTSQFREVFLFKPNITYLL